MRSEVRILVVDDDADLVQGTARVLEQAGYITATALDGVGALEILRTFRPHIVLSDREMPQMDGLELCRRIKSDPALADVLVILVAGTFTGSEEQSEGLDLGADSYIARPIANRELVARVAAFVRILHLSRSLREKNARLELEATERKRSEAALRLDGEIMANMADSVFLIRQSDGTIIHANHQFEKMFGYERGELIGQHVSIVNAPSDKTPGERANEIVEELNQNGKWAGEVRNIKKDGTAFWCSASVTAFQDDSYGTVWIAVHRDITEHKRFEEFQAFLAQTSSGMANESFFNRLARFLAQSLSVDVVRIDHLEGDGLTARTVSVWCDGHFEDNLTYALKGTPCGEVVGKTVCCFPASVCQLFPRDQVLRDLGAESYMGVTLWGHNGEPIGLIAIIARRPLANRSLAEVTLKLVAIRAAAELERQDADASLRLSETKFRTLYDSSPDAVMLLDEKGFSDCNPASLAIFGCASLEEFCAKHPVDLSPPKQPCGTDSLTLANQQITMAMETGRHRFEWFHQRADTGEVFPCEVLLSKMELAGKPVLQAVVRDISERRRAETALLKSKARLDEAQLIAHLGSWECDPLTNMLVWSDETFRIFEIPRESASPSFEAFMERIHPEDRDAVRTAYLRSLENGQPYGITHRLLMPDGRIKWVQEQCETHYTPEGKPLRSVGVVQDITERRRAEEENAKLQTRLHQSLKMESIGQLAGGVAHDFNNILAAMMMHLGLLQRRPNLDGETQEALKDLIAQAKRGASLARQLLLFSRKSVLEVRTLDLNHLVENVLRMLGRLIGEHIELRFARHEGLPEVEADPGMMEQVLMNLSVNARDAMPKGGNLTIGLEPAWVHAERMTGKADSSPGQYVILSVTDTGCGMDAGTQSRIFDPFFTTKEVGKGTGLGLATVYGIVTQHKGWIEVESAVGKGTTFRVFLPVATGRTSQPSQTDTATALRGNETILLVEDQDGLRMVVTRGLQALGYRVLMASNGSAAMKLWREQSGQIDLLFSDMIMPEGLSGLDLAEMFQKEKPDLKVIISSGYHTDLGDHERGIARRVVYLGKPYEMGSLSKTIRECLDRK